MVLNSLFPIFALLALGALLKAFKMTSSEFLNTSDKLIYYIFFPVMLFWKIGSSKTGAAVDWAFCAASICALLILYILSTWYIVKYKIPDFKAGSFSQSCYRFNTYIGMAVILNATGEEGIMYFGILIGIIIPLINVLAVSTLIWFSGFQFSLGHRMQVTIKALISNPLIIACIGGLVYARTVNHFPVYIDNTFHLASLVTLPLALLSIGGSLTLGSIKGYFNLSLIGSFFKLIAFPVLGFLCMTLFRVDPIPFKTGMIFFALPTSPAIYVLSSQLNSDTQLAAATVVLSTVLSFASLSVVLMMA
ncbi:MAG: AEC family transporter [Desulfobacterales bacterium]|nr:AEC family transporter [Desulfobacterales bacterium]MDD4071749.1 AEC family transporter [Desulfobacterales bacterium]MDD4391959.1 AEC family transporter [Desulfobacterales bacterium]